MKWKMPDLGEGVQEGEVVKWLVQEGDSIRMDQHLVEVMTDKATVELPSTFEGTLSKILVKEGQIAKVGQALAVISGEEEEPKTAKKGEPPAKNQEPAQSTKHEVRSTRPLASPALRKLAREKGIDLETIQGSGPGGRITEADLLEKKPAFESPSTRRVREGEAPAALPLEGATQAPIIEERRPLRGLRRKIAEHMVHSRKTAAHFTHVDEADLTELVALRESARQSTQAKGIKLTYLPYIIKAVIEGLKKYPQMNASLDDEKQEIILKKYYNIGVAVATDEGLIVPVVKNADRLSLWDLAREIARLGDAARSRKIALDELKGGTFTLTNIGSIGGILSAPIINYPEVAIMGLHQIKPRVVVQEGKMAIRSMMYLSISADHRVVDGAEVAAFCKAVIGYLEYPAKLF